MPQVNLTAASTQELRQLLDSSRRRGDAALSYQILQEMAARRDTPADRARRLKRRDGEPRHIEIDYSEPEEVDGLPPLPASLSAYDEQVLEAEPEPEPAPPRDFDRPLTLHGSDDGPPDDGGPRYEPVELGAPPPPKRSGFRLIAGLTLGAVLGVSIGWLGGWLARDGMSRAATPVQMAALTPPPAAVVQPVAAPEPAVETPVDSPQPDTASETATPAKAEEPPTSDGATLELPAADLPPPPALPPRRLPDTSRVKPDPIAKVVQIAKADAAEKAAKEPAEPPVSRACATAPTPADRVICGDGKLKRLQADLRHAYEDALSAHEDRDLLREHQLAWRDTRSTVSDPARLARLYEQRIRKLNAATEEARSLR